MRDHSSLYAVGFGFHQAAKKIDKEEFVFKTRTYPKDEEVI
tara:strand:+ start:356 stop:478 length:123 start_codon:yes stop_codon:yes gene_type:complete